MTSTILLSLSIFIFIFASASFCKQSFKVFNKISRTGRKHVHMSLPPCWLLLSFDSRSGRGHNYFTTPIRYHKLTVIVPLSQIQDSSKLANPMSSSASIYIYLTTSISIRLTHGSRKTVANTRFHKKGQAYQKKLSENVIWLPHQIPSIPKKIPYIYTSIPINCLLTEAMN